MRLETIRRKVESINKHQQEKYKSDWRYLKYCHKMSGKFGSTNWCIDLVEEVGHSYRWWEMLRRINGVLVLNTYRYSSSTGKHISNASSIMNSLGVKYKELEAPRGLQDLEQAKRCVIISLARETIKLKYARIKHNGVIKYWTKQLKLLKELGIKVSDRELKQAIDKAENDRTERLREARERREKEATARLITTASDAHQKPEGIL